MLPRAFVTHLALMALLSLAPLPGFTETGADADAEAAPPSTAAEEPEQVLKTKTKSNQSND